MTMTGRLNSKKDGVHFSCSIRLASAAGYVL